MLDSKSDLDFYMATKTFGGEYIWLQRIARKMGKEISFIWPRESRNPLFIFDGLRSKLIFSLCKIFPKGRGLFMNLLIGYCSFPINSKTFISTPYFPIPHNTFIAYIHTPSRKLTVEEDINNGLVKRLFWKIFKRVYRMTYCSSLSNARFVFVNSNTTSERISRLCNLSKSISVLYPTQDPSEFNCGQEENYFFCASRFTAQKNQIFIVEAFIKFCEKIVNYSGVECNYRLVLTGSNPKDNKISNSYFEQLLEVIGRASEDIQKRIEISFDRSREQITEYYSKAFAVLYAGREEDFGQTVVEGMMSCKPVVAINEGGMRETIKDGVNGFLVNSTDQMADKMLVLVNNRSMARSMGLKGKEMVSKFEDDKFLSVILSL